MIREIMKDIMFLQCPSKEATREDVNLVQDLLDTLIAHKEECVGMAANMIGIQKCIIAFWDGLSEKYEVMLNPRIIKTSGKHYVTKEGCLSLCGERDTKRYERIKVQFQKSDLSVRIQSYEGFTAQIIQHEIDHCNGIII